VTIRDAQFCHDTQAFEKQTIIRAGRKEKSGGGVVSAHSWKRRSPLHPSLSLLEGFECNRLWVLKNSLFLKIAGISEIENVYQNGDRRL
jgi:hypothetical protein